MVGRVVVCSSMEGLYQNHMTPNGKKKKGIKKLIYRVPAEEELLQFHHHNQHIQK